MLIKLGRRISRIGVYLFALIGFVLVVGWLALRFGWSNTPGVVDFNDRYFKEVTDKIRNNKQANNQNIAQIIADYNKKHQSAQELSAWLMTPEWQVLRVAITKDKEEINRAAATAGINARLITSVLVGEQMRLYNSDREIYKQIFAPLKILGVQSQFSWGVTGLKEETAKKIEANLRNPNSPFYLGEDKANLLNFSTADPGAERFARLIDSNNHYYSYLYTAIYLKQLVVQWQKAGYDIENRPEILATLFNLGFEKSIPKADPQVGGAEIEIGGQKYSFGSLAYQFYYSNELIDEFNWQ
ncbi:MAG: hypothetical protein WC640_03980 [Candidatus Paceibacterota bacterium]|jgi:hypothetical protein